MLACRIRSDAFLRALLAFTTLASFWAFLPGTIDGQTAFVLYSAPKLTATLIGVWGLLALFVWIRRHRLDTLELWAVISDPPIALLGCFLLLCAISTSWAEVPANGLFELAFYLPLFILTVLLISWMRSDTRVRPAIEMSLIVGAAVATAVGGLQLVFELRWLSPINPLNEVANPSLMGYKNPMALAIAGQLFLLFGRIADPKHRWRGFLTVCALAELVYLGQLQSRTSLAAVTVGAVALLAIAAALPPRSSSFCRLAVATGVGTVLLALSVVAVPTARHKAESLLAYAVTPSSYLESDRGVYLRNTLHMVQHRPWGVGAGDWQTAYPLYRLHDRYRSFDEVYEVRRAHSDYVQLLGEVGWLGLAVWLAFLAAVGLRLSSAYRASRRLADLLLLGQLTVWIAAMASDYVLDLPFHRLAFFLLVSCAVASRSVAETDDERAPAFLPTWARNLCVAMTTLAALLSSVVALSSLRLAYDSAAMTRLYLQALDAEGAQRSQLLLSAASRGGTLLGTEAHSKTRYKDWQVLADVFLRLGNRQAARRCALRALALHPYSPKTFRLLARIDSGEESRRWQEGYDHILHRATAGDPPT